ncbi:MAG TPA: hypothetical protein VFC84_14760 [Desulfosporosinus sp.]|nr:hypothetical protein [Desulfosporosinus sp.]
MLEDLFECLELMKLTPQNVYDQMLKLKNDKVNEVVHVLNNIITSQDNDLRAPSSVYNFVASEDLSGGAKYCASIDCRLNKASEMANFASLYADTVLIKNPFGEYLTYQTYNDTLRNYITNDILIVWYYLPLIKKGIVRFAQTDHQFCSECFEKFSSNEYYSYEKKAEAAYKFLQNEYLNNVSINFENDENFGFLEIRGPEELVQHGITFIHFMHYTPKALLKYANSKGRHKIDRTILEQSGLINHLTDVVIDDFTTQDWYTKNFDFSYLTNRELDIKVINQTNDDDINARNRKLFECLAHQLPVIKDVNIKEILKIREKDGESFGLYRNNMKKLIRELPNKPSHIKEAFSDIVQPEIDKIYISLNESRKSIIKNISKNIIITSGIVYMGLTTGLLPDNIKEIVGVAGGCGLTQTAINNLTDSFTKPNTLRTNPYYFLWKVNKTTKK